MPEDGVLQGGHESCGAAMRSVGSAAPTGVQVAMPTRSLRVQTDYEWLVTAGVVAGVATVERSVTTWERDPRPLAGGFRNVGTLLLWLRGAGHRLLEHLAEQAADEVEEPSAYAGRPAARQVYRDAYVAGVEWAIDACVNATLPDLTPACACARLVFVKRRRGAGSYGLRPLS
jgi:hypothetical protein